MVATTAPLTAAELPALAVDADLHAPPRASAPAPGAGAPPPTLAWRAAAAPMRALSRALWLLDGSCGAAPSPYLCGAFAPVRAEAREPALDVREGALPDGLRGAFLRIGPNPYWGPGIDGKGGRYHWFDGDGMAHAVRLRGRGKSPAYASHWVRTAKLAAEARAGYPALAKIGDMRGVAGLAHLALNALKRALGVLPRAGEGAGAANTALVFHARRLLALHEGDLPYHLRLLCEGALETVGRLSLPGVRHALTAHPKVDAATGQIYGFGYAVDRPPYCWATRLDAAGNVAADFPVPLREGVMMHDFALTERHMVFIDAPLVFRPDAMVKRNDLPFVFDKSRPTRFGVLDRDAADACGIHWFEVPPCMIFHVAAAWHEEDAAAGGPGAIQLFACAFREFSLGDFTAAGPEAQPYLTKFTLDLASGAATAARLSPLAGDFPQVPAARVGRRCRYAYLAAMTSDARGVPCFYGIAKIDLDAAGPDAAVVGLVRHGEGRSAGEAVFAPAPGGAAEDDGWLLTFVTREASRETELVVYDAATMAATPVARVALTHRVPHGFHALWLTEEQIAEQE